MNLPDNKELLSDSTVKSLSVKKYTEDEITSIYELARLSFETGNLKRAEVICSGLIVVAPDFVPSFMLLAIVSSFNSDYERAIELTQKILQLDANNMQAQLLSASIYLNLSNYTMAGTVLGEISEKIRKGVELESVLKRFYDVQLARFEAR